MDNFLETYDTGMDVGYSLLIGKHSYGADSGMSYRHKIPAHVHNVKGHLSSLIKK